MKRIIISVLWICILTGVILLLCFLPVEWNLTLIIILSFLFFFFIIGIVTLIKAEKIATIPLLAGGLSLFGLCAVLEIKHFFLFSLLYLFGFIIHIIIVNENAKTN